MTQVSNETRIGAVEAGGTKMVLAVCTADGTVLERESIPTEAPEACVPKMASWFEGKGIEALGLAAFGPTAVNPRSPQYGHVLNTPKPGWRGYDLLGEMARGTGVPVGYDTDVNAACLGEVTFGSSKGLDCVIYITVGTGVGVGVYVDGSLLHGMLHPEAGHVPVVRVEGDDLECVCPFHDHCLEGMANGVATAARFDLSQPGGVAENEEFLRIESDYLAQGIATYILTYSPQRVVLGGGVPDRNPRLLPLVRQKVLEKLGGYLETPELSDMDSYLIAPSLGGDQGILGSLELGRRALAAND